MKILTSTAMKAAEAAAVERGGSYLDLMENAGGAAAKRIAALLNGIAGKQALIFCGKGNNGGDGLVIARKFLEAGALVTVIFAQGCGDAGVDEQKLSPLSRANLRAMDGWGEDRLLILDCTLGDEQLAALVQQAAVIVDAVFGTGFSGILPAGTARLNRAAAKACGLLCALDIPSGVNCDTGEADADSFPAEVTFAFAALKPAHVLKASALRCGRVELLDIGIGRSDMDALPSAIAPLTRTLAANALPRRSPDSHKGSYGRLLNVGGCRHMTGAVMLSTLAAMAGGAGLVKVAAPDAATPLIAGRILPCIHAPLPTAENGAISFEGIDRLSEELCWATTLLLGCGLSVCEDTKLLVEELITQTQIPAVLDADALNCLVGRPSLLRRASAPLILTPHLMEMSRLTGEPLEHCRSRRFDLAASFAREYQVTLVLKDSSTVVAAPDGSLYMTAPPKRTVDGIPVFEGSSTSGLAKGGSGDILAGLIAAMLAQGASPLQAALCGVWLHARAADLCEEEMTAYCMQPTDVLRFLPAAFKLL